MDSRLFSLLRDFLYLKPTNSLKFTSDVHPQLLNEFFVNHVLLNLHFQQYPPSHQYQKRFWKWAIENLEDGARKLEGEERDDFEIDSQIYEHYLSLMPPARPITGSSDLATRTQIYGRGIPLHEAPPSQSYITHFWDMQHPGLKSPKTEHEIDMKKFHTVTLLESRTTIESGTTGLRTWLASFVLTQYLILRPELVISKRILELGSGIGFLGIIVATLQRLYKAEFSPSTGGKNFGSLWLTDINDEVLARCRDNINLPCNILSSHKNINYVKLDWSASLETDAGHISSLKTLIQERMDPELILGADVVFDPTLVPALVGTLKIALQTSDPSASPKIGIIAVTIRNEETVGRFLSHVQEAYLHIEELEPGFQNTSFAETVEAHNSCEDIKLFRITLPRQSEAKLPND